MNYSTVTIDWRWETLVKSLTQMIPLLDALRATFDLTKMKDSEEGSSEAVLLSEVEKAS